MSQIPTLSSPLSMLSRTYTACALIDPLAANPRVGPHRRRYGIGNLDPPGAFMPHPITVRCERTSIQGWICRKRSSAIASAAANFSADARPSPSRQRLSMRSTEMRSMSSPISAG